MNSSETVKVCVVNPNYYRSSGVTVSCRGIFAGVTPLGIEQYFVNCCYGTEVEDVSWIPADKLVTFRLMASSPRILLSEALAFVRWLRKNEIHVVHVHHRRLAVILGFLERLGNFRLIYTAALSYPKESWFYWGSPRIAVAITPSVRLNLQKTARVKWIELIGNPSAFPEHCPDASLHDLTPSVICVARLDPVKGHTYLLQAWARLRERGIQAKLVLIGEGTLKQELTDQVAALGLNEWVDFRGYCQDVAAEIDRCLFSVLVSEVEGQGIVILEAAARGRPTLVTDVDGARDGVPDGVSLPNRVPFGDIEALAEALAAWLAAPEQVVSDGRVFFDFHKSHHATDVIAEKYAGLYRRVESRSNASRP